MKLELDPQQQLEELRMILDSLTGVKNLDFREIQKADRRPSYPSKEPVEIVGDFLSSIRECVVEELL
jgi:hypothetical protein